MIVLREIVYKVSIEVVKGSTDIAINTIHFDSRKIGSNDLFIAIRGTQSDGHKYISYPKTSVLPLSETTFFSQSERMI